MNPLLFLVGGGALVYFFLRHRDAEAGKAPDESLQPTTLPATSSPPVPSGQGKIAVSRPPQPEVPRPTLPQPSQLTGRWGWPVPRYEGRAPVISDGFRLPRRDHNGVDIMFARAVSDRFPVGSPNGTKGYVMPDAWMAVAASDGILWSSGHTPRGYAVVIDHGTAVTFYTHLDTLFVPEVRPPAKGITPAKVIAIKAGQPLGVIGADPQDRERIKHLHFELWRGGPADAVDPAPLMKTWQVFTPNDIAPFLPSLTRNAAKQSEFVQVRAHERRWPGTALHPPR